MTTGPENVPEGGIVAEVAQMSEEERAEHFAEVAEAVAADRDVAVEIGGTLLEVHDVTVRFGGLTALDEVSFGVQRGEILGLIGPNGAGKTTCFNAMTGVYRPTSGRLLLMVLMIFRPQGLLGARQRLLARGRQAYQRLVGRGEQISNESSVASSGEEGRAA